MSLFRALFAELLKLKRTLALRVALLLPLLVAVLEFFIILKTKTPPPASTFLEDSRNELTRNLGRLHDAVIDNP